ncbi:sugar transferase [Ulvibacter antarcticus]|uniref:Lipopolysaccharide/colanic/teichoic acid biosynthesis glycosyltransferase n=1 Tax=Ulvibacter antarcticus TaxID=442714 RepID=A0A3L9YLR9_9FLAO|nr:sugar transferase [Ulvibacter antarcticus]RMA58958.1 lipopolysaccharide/colanic/teichoic acid biosynthesis glycosyltransferase [Ulvibacter antarcticus]
MYLNLIKPFFDFLASAIFLIVISPVLLIITVLLYIANDGKPFFFQKRPGKGERIFSIIKFKTMNDRKDASGALLPDEDRLTKVGGFIRKTSLDELPQFVNVVKGDMSIVGPRPLLPEYLSLYTDFQKQRHNVRPGITGWTQVNGRNENSWERKLELDIHYVEHQNFWFDFKIILATFKKVIIREGIYNTEEIKEPNTSSTKK